MTPNCVIGLAPSDVADGPKYMGNANEELPTPEE